MALREAPPQIGDRASSGHAGGDQVHILDLSGGIDRSRAPNEIPQNALRFVQNAYYPREALQLQTRPGAGAFQVLATAPATDPPGRITAGHVYTKSTTQSYLVFSCLTVAGDDQELWCIDLATGASRAPVLLLNSLSSTTTPTFKTLNARLLVAVPGQYIREWGGEFDGIGGAAARDTGDVTVDTSNVNVGDWVTVGERTFTFYADAVSSRPGEVQIGATAAQSATNLKAAIDQRCTEVRTTGLTTATIDLEVRRAGVEGTALQVGAENGGSLAGRLSRTVFSGAEPGLAFDTIDTYDAPKPGIIIGDRNGRLVAGSCTVHPDRVYFSRAGNPYDWRVSPFGQAQRWDQGYQEGNVITAIAPFYDELWVHKRGQDREIYRARIADPTPLTWELQWRPHEEVNAAVNARCAITLAGKQVVVDAKGVVVYTGDDTYNEVRSAYEGTKVADLFPDFLSATAFIAPNPAEVYALIFPGVSDYCLCYHFASGRWTTWKFGVPVSAAIYCEPLGVMLVASGTMWYQLTPNLAADAGLAGFKTQITTRTLDAGAAEFVHKQIIIDYEHLLAGRVTVSAIQNREEQTARELLVFDVLERSLLIDDATAVIYAVPDLGFFGSAPSYGRGVDYETAVGEMLAYQMEMVGAARINSVRVRLAQEGRAMA